MATINWPDRIELARTPTPIQFLSRLSEEVGVEIHVKRDDLTGVELSGNKVRKLEFLLRDALDQGARRVYTCGGIQSNHARATAAAAARLGLSSLLFLRVRTEPPAHAEGNVLLDLLAGAEITHITPEEYRRADELMAARAVTEDPPAYPIPEGGSNALGALGYARAVEEIVKQERELGITFDAVVHACGSGGTSAGLILGRKALGLSAPIFGVNVCDDEAYFKERIAGILSDAAEQYAPSLSFSEDDVLILDGHVGPGYAENTEEDFEIIRRLARTEGLFLDPVYSVKAMKGMLKELKGGRLAGMKRILFIHTGGIFGLFPKADDLVGPLTP